MGYAANYFKKSHTNHGTQISCPRLDVEYSCRLCTSICWSHWICHGNLSVFNHGAKVFGSNQYTRAELCLLVRSVLVSRVLVLELVLHRRLVRGRFRFGAIDRGMAAMFLSARCGRAVPVDVPAFILRGFSAHRCCNVDR